MMNQSTDDDLVRDCLQGSQQAWTVLIRRYRHLVYSVIRSYHMPDKDAADVFQSVCLELYHSLSRLRETAALRRWLITVTSHECLRWRRSHQPIAAEEAVDLELLPDGHTSAAYSRIEREQILRQALDRVPQRCREMVVMLFLEDPPIPYAEAASRLGLAVGSIGFIRKRCLKKLKAALEELGF